MRLTHTTAAEDTILTAADDAAACAEVAQRLDDLIREKDKDHALEIETLEDQIADLAAKLKAQE